MLDYCGIIRKESHTIKTNRTVSLQSHHKQFKQRSVYWKLSHIKKYKKNRTVSLQSHHKHFKQRSVYWKLSHIKNYSISFYTPSCVFLQARERDLPINKDILFGKKRPMYYWWHLLTVSLWYLFYGKPNGVLRGLVCGWEGGVGISVARSQHVGGLYTYIHTYPAFQKRLSPRIILTKWGGGGGGLRGYDVLNSV